MKNVIIAGASGMIGNLILEHCLSSSSVAQVIALVRRRTQNEHPKLKEIVIENFADYSDSSSFFQNIDTAFFCIGVYTGQAPDNEFKIITVDFAVAFAQALKANSPKATLCLLSGAGTSRSDVSGWNEWNGNGNIGK